MKAVLISIKPKWVEKIVSGEKTIKVCKTRPKLEVPFKCYIYETKDKKYEHIGITGFKKAVGKYCFVNHIGKVIGEFVCDRIDIDVVSLKPNDIEPCYWKLINGSCLTKNELMNYGKYNALYGWHISNLKIYDKPKELSEFKKPCDRFLDCITCKRLVRNDFLSCDNIITRPPQSWQYVEDLGV